MNYNVFKETLEKPTTNYDKLYKDLKQQYGKLFVDSLYEKYMNDSTIDDEIKFERIAPYLDAQEIDSEIINENYNETEEDPFYYFNSYDDQVRIYLNEMGHIPLLTKEEEYKYAVEIKALSNEVEAREITDESLNERLKLWGLDNIKTDLDSRRKQKKYLESLQKQMLENLQKQMNEKNLIQNKEQLEKLIQLELEKIIQLEELIKDINTYYEYYTKKNAFCDKNLRLVISIAKRYVGRGMLFLDLIQEGNLGLMKAVEKFDPSKNYKFSTYATWWIRQLITRGIADQARTIRIPVHMVEQINKYIRTERFLTTDLGRKPTDEEISQILNWTIDKTRYIARIALEPVSLETPIGEDEDSYLGDFVPANDGEDIVENEATTTLLRASLEEAIATLTDREAEIIKQRFGFDDGTPKTLDQIGKQFKVTRERIRQVEAKALRKLRHPSRSRKLEDFLH